jgi:hypothetical protein
VPRAVRGDGHMIVLGVCLVVLAAVVVGLSVLLTGRPEGVRRFFWRRYQHVMHVVDTFETRSRSRAAKANQAKAGGDF